jgi:hypothetical protein
MQRLHSFFKVARLRMCCLLLINEYNMRPGDGLYLNSSTPKDSCPLWWNKGISASLFLFMLIISSNIGFAQSDPVSVLTVNNGLASGTIECAIFDSKGFLWIGTRAGLQRFDGKNIALYYPDITDPRSIASTLIFFLAEDHYGQIWIIGDKGLEVFIPDENCFERLPGLTYDDVAGLCIIDSMDIGIVHSCRSSNTFSPVISLKDRRFLDHKSELTKVQQTLLEDFWLRKVSGQFFTNQEHQAYNYRKYFSDQNDEVVRCIREGDEMWFYSRKKGGFTKLTDGEKESEWIPVHHSWPEIEKDGLMTMMSYNDSLGLAGLYGFGILLFHKNTGEVLRSWDFRHNPLLSRTSSIEFLTKDDQGRIWFSLMPYGLSVFNPMSPRFQLLRNGEPSSILHQGLMRSLMCDALGRLWIGYHDGIVQVMDRDVEKELFRFSIPEDRNHVKTMVTTIDQLSNGQILINNNISISVKKETVSFKSLMHPDYVYDPGFHHPVYPPGKVSFYYGFPPNSIIVVDSVSTNRYYLTKKLPILARTFYINDHLVFFSSINNRFGLFSCADSDSCNLIQDIRYGDFRISGLYHAPGSDTLWLATDKGLGFYNIKSYAFSTVDTRSWPNSYLYGLLPDDEGNLWISSNGGLIRYNPKTKATRFIRVPEGMQSNEFNANCFAKMQDGSLAFAGPDGLNVFHPSYFEDRDDAFFVYASSASISEQPLESFNPFDTNFSITLHPNDKSFEVNYSATKYLNRTGLTYFVKLDGADQDWVNRGEQESVRYINLKPKTYRLRIKAKDGMGNWSQNEINREIIVRPTFFQTTWFLLLCIFSLTGILYVLYQYRIRQLKKIMLIRTRIGRDLHDDIGSTLGSISIYSEVAKSTSGDHRTDVLDKIGEASREMLEKLNDIVWSINPDNDSLERMEKRMRSYAAMLLNPLGIAFDLTLSSDDPTARLDMEHRRHLFLIFKEALHNAAKYAECRQINIVLAEQNGLIQMEIRDDGKGFDPFTSKGYNGNGLDSMKERAKAIHANLHIDSRPGHGTSIHIRQN